jgi:cell division protein FtsQ
VTDTQSPDRQAARILGSARRRFQRRQWARRWRALRWPALVAALVALAGLGFWVVFFSSFLVVRSVSVEGAHVLSASAVEEAAAVPVGVPLAQVKVGAITARVERLPAVESASVSRVWPDTIQISVTERTAVAAVIEGGSQGGSSWALSADGVLFAPMKGASPGLPEIHVSADPSADTLREGADLLAALPESLVGRLTFVDLGSPDDITLHLDNGDLVRWGSADQTETKAAVLAALLQQKGSVYDVSSPGQPTVSR